MVLSDLAEVCSHASRGVLESVKILTRDAEFNISLVDDSIGKILIL